PLVVFREGRFDDWQALQNNRRRIFNRPRLLSLVQAGSPTRWLYVGLFDVLGSEPNRDDPKHVNYSLVRIPSAEEWVGRLYVGSESTNVQTLLSGKTLTADLMVTQLLPERLPIAAFPGFKGVNLSFSELELIVRNNEPQWQGALASVNGIYVITDTITGRLYVGNASGTEGIWGRWSVYAASAHGGNVGLKEEFGAAAHERRDALRFAILEIADLSATDRYIDE